MVTFLKVKLGDIADVVDSRHQTPTYTQTGYPMVRVTDIKPGYLKIDGCLKVNEDVYNHFSYKHKSKKGDIVFSRVGSEGIASLVTSDEPFCLGQNTAFIIPKNENKFLYYWLNSTLGKYEIKTRTTGSTQRTISLESIKKLELSVPPVPTQWEISSILSAYDDLIENNEKRIKALEEMAQLLYTEWFVKFKFPGHKKVKMVDSRTEYGMVPEGWEIGTVSDVANVVSGFSFKGSTYQESGKYKIVTIKNVHDGKFVLNFDSFIDELPSKIPATCILESGDILLSLTGNVGRICVVYGADHVLNQRVAKLDPVNQDYREFIYSLFRQRRFQQKLEAMSNGAAQQNLSPVQVKDIKIIVPKLEILNEFSQICGKYFDMSLYLQEKNQILSKTRDLLIPQLVTGRRELK